MGQMAVDSFMGTTHPHRMLAGLRSLDAEDEEILKREKYRHRHPSLYFDSLDTGPVQKKKGASSPQTTSPVDSSIPHVKPVLRTYESHPSIGTKKVSRRKYDIHKAFRTGEV